MSLDLFETPVRVTWDFPVPGETIAIDCRAVAVRLAEGGIFSLSMLGHPLSCAMIDGILANLGGSPVLINCHGRDDELRRLAAIPLSRCQVQLDATGYIDGAGRLLVDRLTESLERLRRFGFDATLSVTPLRQNLALIPDLLRFCTAQSVPKIKLPNAHIGDSFHGYSPQDLPRSSDLVTFRQNWSEFRDSAGPLPVMEIHDLFLWEIMTPGQEQLRSEYGGCQAGNSLAHVDGRGIVHPCAAWPQPLGRLPEQSLEDIWAGEARMNVCATIARTPRDCAGCRDLDVCFGGCRGLAYHLNGGSDRRDLMCSGRR